MFTSVHNLDPLPLDQNPNSQFVSFKYFANLVTLGFQHLVDLSKTSKSLMSLITKLTNIHIEFCYLH